MEIRIKVKIYNLFFHMDIVLPHLVVISTNIKPSKHIENKIEIEIIDV